VKKGWKALHFTMRILKIETVTLNVLPRQHCVQFWNMGRCAGILTGPEKCVRSHLHITGMIQTGKPWHSAERELAYVLSAKRTWEMSLEGYGYSLQRPCYLSTVDHERKISSRQQRTDMISENIPL
jgi:hypothetical protein